MADTRSTIPELEQLDNQVETARLGPIFRAFDTQLRAARDAERIARNARPDTSEELFEREVRLAHSANQRASLAIDPDTLVLGRLDLVGGDSEGNSLTIGRIGLRSSDMDVLLVDWRAPQAARFFQATASSPMGVRRKRTFSVTGREVVDIDDDLFDPTFEPSIVRGQGGLLKALSAPTGRYMRDIVGTIQAEQDAIIRFDPSRSCIVTGAAGTGKTVVALHKVSYMIYSRAEEVDRRGVLIVGPTAGFGEYISRVLPALGESAVQYRSLASLVSLPPKMSVDFTRDQELAVLKGRLGLAKRLRPVAVEILPRYGEDFSIRIGAATVTLTADELNGIRRAVLLRSRGPINDGARSLVPALLNMIVERANLRYPERVTKDESIVRQAGYLADSLVPSQSAHDLWRSLATASGQTARVFQPVLSLSEAEQVLNSLHPRKLAIDDLPMLFWLGRHLGKRRRMPWDEPEEDTSALLSEVTNTEERLFSTPTRTAIEDRDKFGLVVVDEAQDLTPMQWSVLKERGADATWVVVGDEAQSFLPDAKPLTETTRSLAPGGKSFREFHLDINYRTPTEIAAYVASIFGTRARLPSTPRTVGVKPVVALLDRETELTSAHVSMVLGEVGSYGRVALIVRDRAEYRHFATEDLQVLTADDAKGLEWDTVVLVMPEELSEPARELSESNSLYVAMTRSTSRLGLITRDRRFGWSASVTTRCL